jgi:hypothetical protein
MKANMVMSVVFLCMLGGASSACKEECPSGTMHVAGGFGGLDSCGDRCVPVHTHGQPCTLSPCTTHCAPGLFCQGLCGGVCLSPGEPCPESPQSRPARSVDDLMNSFRIGH